MMRHARSLLIVAAALALSAPPAEAGGGRIARSGKSKGKVSRAQTAGKARTRARSRRTGERSRRSGSKAFERGKPTQKTLRYRKTRLANLVRNARVKPGVIEARGLPKAPRAGGTLLVVNKGPSLGKRDTSSLMFVDLATGKVQKTLRLREGPHEIATSPDHSLAVIPNYGRQPQESGVKTGGGTSISVLDVKKQSVEHIDLPGYFRPHGVEWVDSKRVALTVDGTRKGANKNIREGRVLIVNTRTKKIEKAIKTGQPGSHLVRLSPDKKHLYVSNIQGGSLSIVKNPAGAGSGSWSGAHLVKVLKTGKGAEAIDISPNGKELWIGNQESNTVTVLDTRTHEPIRTFEADGGPIRIKFLPGGKRALLSLRGANAVSIVSARSGRELKRVPMEVSKVTESGATGDSSVPMMIQLNPKTPHLAYVGNSHSKLVSVLDVNRGEVVGYYKAGDKPDPLAWVPSRPGKARSAHRERGPAPIRGKENAYLKEKYDRAKGFRRGLYEGKGQGRRYQLPRRVDPAKDGTKLAARFRPHFRSARQYRARGIEPGSLKVGEFTRLLEKATPKGVLKEIDRVIERAIVLGEEGLAAPFPKKERAEIRMALIYSYLHSRDMTVIMHSLGYPLNVTGVHDIREYAHGKDIKKLARTTDKARWFKRYAETLGDSQEVNISFMNPHWLADIWKWTPKDGLQQNAMDAHRLSDHHSGHDGKWDPIEHAVNNVFHRREHRFGVRKEGKMPWIDLGAKLEAAEGAQKLVKSHIGVPIARDAAKLMRKLEREGKITPWYLVDPKAWH